MSDPRSPEPNFPNRTLAVMDNLDFLRALDNECIDLIAIDPPFAANETFRGRPRPPITDAERGEERALAARHDALARYAKEDAQLTSVKDDWFWRDVESDWRNELRNVGKRVKAWDKRVEDGADLNPDEAPGERDRTLAAIGEVVDAVSVCATENEAAYIALMAVRLIECRRVLKDTGSIYLHCDWHANSYLRMLMDAIFGSNNFRNEIIWKSSYGGKNMSTKKFGRGHDSIYFYAMPNAVFNPIMLALSEASRTDWYRYIDEEGRRYKVGDLAAPGSGGYEYEFLGATRQWRYPQHRMEELLRKGLIVHKTTVAGSKRNVAGFKQYLEDSRGRAATTLWDDINPINRGAKEGTGYATQKPLELYRRIIRASSNPGDVVLDLFAGCATTVVAAEIEGRNWLACDHAYRASTMMMRRFYQNGHRLRGMNVDVVRGALGEHQIQFEHPDGQIMGPPDLARFPRATKDPDDGPPTLIAPRRERISSLWNGSISKPRSKNILLREHGCVCWGCGKHPKLPNGADDPDELEVDHIFPRKPADGGAGGEDDLYNLSLVCRKCNGRKGNRLTLEELRLDRERENLLWVERKDLVHLGRALQTALELQRRYGKQESPAT